MKRILLLPLLLTGLFVATRSVAQLHAVNGKDSVTRLFRVYEDNDGINIFGQSTDDAYTNGTRVDLFYSPVHRPHGLLGKFGLRAGAGSVDIYSWSLSQLMYTPMDYTKTGFQANDYPYSGAMFFSHGRYSFNPEKNYAFQTELVIGAVGPVSLAHQTQSIVHHLTGYLQPEGWSTQFRNSPLLNLNWTAEKQLVSRGSAFEMIGGAQVFAGTMQNGAAIYPMIRFGKMNPYFDGLFSQYTSGRDAEGKKKWQLYFFAKPQLQYYLTNALLEGGIFTHNPNVPRTAGTKPSSASFSQEPAPKAVNIAGLNHWVAALSYGGVFSSGNFSIACTQSVSSSTLKRLYCHDVGNVSLYFGW
jgi:lipid A 3-O-deacylase